MSTNALLIIIYLYMLGNCKNCAKEFEIKPREISRGFGKFCSRSCSSTYNRRNVEKTGVIVNCSYCNVSFYKTKFKISQSKSGLFFCSREHKDLAQKMGGIKEIQPNHYGSSLKDYRKIAFASQARICSRCGFSNPAAIIVHHKERNRDNNDESNLEILCCNCHAIEHYGGAKEI